MNETFKNELKRMADVVLFDNDGGNEYDREIIHISHTDLDGYGCSALTMLAAEYNSNAVNFINADLFDWKSFSLTITTALQLAKYPTDIIITDLGHIDLEKLKYFTHFVENIFVIDHHQLQYDIPKGFTAIESKVPGMGTIYKYEGSYGSNITFYHNTAKSATWNYFQIIKESKYIDRILNDRKLLEKAVNGISNYDTGKFGNFNIGLPYQMELNFRFNFFEEYNIPTKNEETITEVLDAILDEHSLDSIINDYVDKAYKKFTDEYDEWKNSLTKGILFAGTNALKDPESYEFASISVDSDMTCYLKVYDDDDNHPYSVYSAQFLEEVVSGPTPDLNQIIVIWLKNRGEHGIISLRSFAGGPDVSHIAKMNGGGGHVRAAGFSITE